MFWKGKLRFQIKAMFDFIASKLYSLWLPCKNSWKYRHIENNMKVNFCESDSVSNWLKMNQLMRFWYLSHRRPAVRTHKVWKYGSRQRVRPKNQTSSHTGQRMRVWRMVYGGRKVPWFHKLAQITLSRLEIILNSTQQTVEKTQIIYRYESSAC